MNDRNGRSVNDRELKSAEKWVEIPGINIISRFPLPNDTRRKDTMNE